MPFVPPLALEYLGRWSQVAYFLGMDWRKSLRYTWGVPFDYDLMHRWVDGYDWEVWWGNVQQSIQPCMNMLRPTPADIEPVLESWQINEVVSNCFALTGDFFNRRWMVPRLNFNSCFCHEFKLALNNENGQHWLVYNSNIFKLQHGQVWADSVWTRGPMLFRFRVKQKRTEVEMQTNVPARALPEPEIPRRWGHAQGLPPRPASMSLAWAFLPCRAWVAPAAAWVLGTTTYNNFAAT